MSIGTLSTVAPWSGVVNRFQGQLPASFRRYNREHSLVKTRKNQIETTLDN